MHVNLVKLITCTSFFVTLLHQASNQITNTNSTVTTRNIAYDCTTPRQTPGLCVQAQKCNLNYTESDRNAACNLPHQNPKKPYVCCELKRVKLDTSLENTPNQIVPSPSTTMCGTQLLSRIVGGEGTVPEEFPWMARLMRVNAINEYSFSCTGALISKKVVLTAAHCILSPELSQLGRLDAVNLGEHETECKFEQPNCLVNQKIVKVAKAIAHHNYLVESRNQQDDIGLLILAEEVAFTKSISPICLLEKPYDAAYYVVSGWGTTETEATSRIKLKTKLTPFSWPQCAEKYKVLSIAVSKRQICAGGVQGRDSCQGDSGGPLMVLKNDSWFVAGVVSLGVGCGKEGWPGLYSHVPSYINWIQKKINNA